MISSARMGKPRPAVKALGSVQLGFTLLSDSVAGEKRLETV